MLDLDDDVVEDKEYSFDVYVSGEGAAWKEELCATCARGGVSYYHAPPDDSRNIGEWQNDTKRDECEVLLFVIEANKRATLTMLDATECIYTGRFVILVLESMRTRELEGGERLTQAQFSDLVNTRASLSDIAAQHASQCTIFESVPDAAKFIVELFVNDDISSTATASTNRPTRTSKRSRRSRSVCSSIHNSGVHSAAFARKNSSPEWERLPQAPEAESISEAVHTSSAKQYTTQSPDPVVAGSGDPASTNVLSSHPSYSAVINIISESSEPTRSRHAGKLAGSPAGGARRKRSCRRRITQK